MKHYSFFSLSKITSLILTVCAIYTPSTLIARKIKKNYRKQTLLVAENKAYDKSMHPQAIPKDANPSYSPAYMSNITNTGGFILSPNLDLEIKSQTEHALPLKGETDAGPKTKTIPNQFPSVDSTRVPQIKK